MTVRVQTLPVIYKHIEYMVDPSQMYNASRLFQQLSQPFVSKGITQLIIRINSEKYTERSIKNFLQLCQGLSSDVLDSEMTEICEIAKMFQADQIYNTGANFIRSKFNPNFNIPDYPFNSTQPFLTVEKHANQRPLSLTLSADDFEFDSDDDNDRIKIEHNPIACSQASFDLQQTQQPQNQNTPTKIYEIRIEKQMMKCTRFYFIDNGNIMYVAKKKGGKLLFGKGNDVHFEGNTDNHVAIINQSEMTNEMRLEHQNIMLKYAKCPDSGAISMSVCFNHQGNQLLWLPRMPQLNPATGVYGLHLSGTQNRTAMVSKKNIAMKDPDGKTTFICRKMAENFYEVELDPEISPLIAFALGVSAIIGPRIIP